MSRLETLASMSETEIPFHALRDQVNTAVDVIVQLQRAPDGTRRVIEVGYLASRRREEFRVQPVMRYDQDAVHESGRRGDFVRLPVPPALVERLAQRGEEMPAGFRIAGPEQPEPWSEQGEPWPKQPDPWPRDRG
jgi:pilus assembly protein CpaF